MKTSTTVEADLVLSDEDTPRPLPGRLAVVGPELSDSLALPLQRTGPVRQQVAPALSRWLRSIPLVSFLLLVVTPTVLGAAYLLAIASNQYTSEFRVTVRSVQPLAQASGLVSMLGLAGMSQASTDSHAVVQYLQSRRAIEDINGTVPMRKAFEAPDIDWFSRLSPTSSIEGLARYWDKMLDIYFENTTSTIVVRVAAFTPESARDIAQGMLTLSEKLVNMLSERSRADTMAAAEEAVISTDARLTEVSQKLKTLRDAEGVLDPKKAAEATLTLAAHLRGQISSANADLEAMRRYLSETSPSVMQAKDHLAALNNELSHINAEATSTATGPGDRPLSSVLGSFEQLENDRVFAEKAYQSALAASETAKLEAARQQVYLATIVPPELAEEPSFPRPFRNIGTLFAMCLAGWIILLFGFSAVREHM